MGEAILLTELSMEMVNKEEEEENELHSITRKFAAFYTLEPLYEEHPVCLEVSNCAFPNLSPFPTSRPTNACTGTGPGQLLFPPEEPTRHMACSARLYLKPSPSSAFIS